MALLTAIGGGGKGKTRFISLPAPEVPPEEIPLELTVSYPDKIDIRETTQWQILTGILPEEARQDVSFAVEGESISVDEEGWIGVTGQGTSSLTVVSLRNPVLKKTVNIEVEKESVRFAGTVFRLTAEGGIRLT
ncbi:hypothetical protein EZS27_004581 [termite gut metagenome]|uniref:BIG2 domain-containing protein n=1 Tax=termite gut metagenome TaxID=433724 RepID=A0A5J4SP19_9ZZZZ